VTDKTKNEMVDSHIKLGGDWFCERCNSWHGTSVIDCCDHNVFDELITESKSNLPTINTLIQVSKGFFMMPHQLDAAKEEAEAMIEYIESKRLKIG